jgi:hypothetical protein
MQIIAIFQRGLQNKGSAERDWDCPHFAAPFQSPFCCAIYCASISPIRTDNRLAQSPLVFSLIFANRLVKANGGS